MYFYSCLLIEFLIGKPLFYEAKSSSPMLMQLIYNRLGVPTDDEWSQFRGLPNYNDKAPPGLLPRILFQKIKASRPNIDELALDLVDKMLTLNPANRCSALEALAHPWFHSEPYPCAPSRYAMPSKQAY
jgi:serine/threonine protein kinase